MGAPDQNAAVFLPYGLCTPGLFRFSITSVPVTVPIAVDLYFQRGIVTGFQ